jgi:hypothetical protein
VIIPLLAGSPADSHHSGKDIILVYNYYKNNFIFNSGFWVYMDTVSQEVDSITLDNVKHGFYGPNPVIPDEREYYQVEYSSHTNDSVFNDFFMENLWRVNGGGEYGELGQPIMWVGYYGPVLGGFNGFEIVEILDSLVVGSNTFHTVAKSHIDEDEQYQHEFNYDTDLFFDEGVGIIRKEYTDAEGTHHVWDLVNWENSPLTGFEEQCMESVTVYPNPAAGEIHISPEMNYKTVIYSSNGQVLRINFGSSMDLNNLPGGIYYLRICQPDDKLIHFEKILKLAE